jgi:ubiquinone/menaquinone biosynthesis C-methylase UbiE
VWGEIGRQLRAPSGSLGWAAGHVMRVVNTRPNALAVAALRLRPGDEILELGCGPGQAVRLMAARLPQVTIHAIDRSAVMLAQARSRNRAAVCCGQVRLYQAAFEQLPLRSHSIDKILAVNVAYFWDDVPAVLGEIDRVLRPGGRLSLYVTHASTMRRWPFADPLTHHLFDHAELAATLCRGFPHGSIRVSEVCVIPGVTGLIATAEKRRLAAGHFSPGSDPDGRIGISRV